MPTTSSAHSTATPATPATDAPDQPATMHAAAHRRYGAATDVVEIAEVAVPEPEPKEVLIEVAASSLNALDHHMVTGTPYLLRLVGGLRRPKRSIIGADVAGTVVAVGTHVTDRRVGDEIVTLVNGGGCAPFVATTTSGMVERPDTVSVDDAATTPVAGLTALQGLRTHARLAPGERLLINGAAGGVGSFAVQVAAAIGAHVTAVCSTRNVEMIRTLGAHDVIDYTTTDLVEEMTRRGDHFDVVFDNVGNLPARILARLATDDGRVALTTGPKQNRLFGPITHMVTTRLSFVFRSAEFTSFTADANADDLATLLEMVRAGQIRPWVDRVVALDGVADGLAEIATGHARAKIVVHPAG